MANDYAKDLIFISPLLTLTVGALLMLIYEVFIKRPWSKGAFAFIVLITAFLLNFYLLYNNFYIVPRTAFSGQIYVDNFSGFVNCFILITAAVAVLLSMSHIETEKINSPGEYYALLLMTTIGALIFNSSAEFITLFIGLEIMSMALYCLCGSATAIRGSAESALKYFFLGSFSSAFMLYGIAILYGLTGSTELLIISHNIGFTDTALPAVAIGLILVGLLFKIAAVPFHFWAPDVYQGAPTPVTIYMASVIKASAVVVSLRVLWTAFPQSLQIWTGAVWTLAILTMTLGNLIALRQRSLKRMLAYSSIAHAGYMMVALLVAAPEYGGAAAVVFYLVAYSAMTLGSFAIVMAIAAPKSGQPLSDDISHFNGLYKKHPLLAALMALFMLSLAGIPPGMVGLLGKFYVFNSAVKAGFVGLAVIGVLNSAVSVYYYLRVVVAMYFIEQTAGEQENKTHVGLPMAAGLTVCALAVILLGLFPSRLYQNAQTAVEPLFPDSEGVFTIKYRK